MANDYYVKSGTPGQNAQGSSANMRAEFSAIEAAFDKMPDLTGSAGKYVRVNSGATGLEATSVLEIGQIKFPATQSASSDANTLDDYEEGLHVATITSPGGTITLSSSGDTLAYTKIGRKVTVVGQLDISSASMTPGLDMYVSLPFAAADLSEFGDRSYSVIVYYPGALPYKAAYTYTTLSQLVVFSNFSDVVLAANHSIGICITYFTA